MTTSTSVSTREFLTESISSITNELYGSDTFESTFSSETFTLNRLSGSHNTASTLHDSPSHTSKSNTLNGGHTCEERSSPTHTVPADDEQCSAPAEIFLNRNLELLRVKQGSQTDTSCVKEADNLTVLALTQSDTSIQHSKAEKSYTEACLGRLKHVHVEECSSGNHRIQHKEIDTTKPFTRQCEILKLESLKHMMETQIKRLQADGVDEQYQAFTCVECKNQQHDMAEKQFVCHKLKLLTHTDFREKLDKHLYQMDSLTLLGDIVGSCIRPSAPDSDVWKAMADKMTQLKTESQGH